MNQYSNNRIEICDEFWPYTKTENVLKPSDTEAYVKQIRALLAARPCVKCVFSVADQKFAADLLARQVSVEQIEAAIALGCSRKYVSLLKGFDSGPIGSLAYFRDLIEEVGESSEMPDWAIQKLMLLKYEDLWIARRDAACANIAPAKNIKLKQTR